MASQVLDALPREARVFPACEIGSGRAAAGFRLADTGRGSVFALDLSHFVLRRIADESGGRIRGIVGNAYAAPFRTGSIGLAFNISTLEHFIDPIPVLKEMGRIAGYVMVAVPAASRLWEGLLRIMARAGYQGAGDYYHLYEESLLREHLVAAGLHILQVRKVFFFSLFPFWVATAVRN